VVLAALIKADPKGLTEVEVQAQMTSIEDTPQRIEAIGRAIEGLIEVGLVVRSGELLRPTLASLRAGELELGL
jgi:hypothetical protein